MADSDNRDILVSLPLKPDDAQVLADLCPRLTYEQLYRIAWRGVGETPDTIWAWLTALHRIGDGLAALGYRPKNGEGGE